MLSIIIPALNQHEMTADCVAAIRSCTAAEHEVILPGMARQDGGIAGEQSHEERRALALREMVQASGQAPRPTAPVLTTDAIERARTRTIRGNLRRHAAKQVRPPKVEGGPELGV